MTTDECIAKFREKASTAALKVHNERKEGSALYENLDREQCAEFDFFEGRASGFDLGLRVGELKGRIEALRQGRRASIQHCELPVIEENFEKAERAAEAELSALLSGTDGGERG